jgi:hypothetical protein
MELALFEVGRFQAPLISTLFPLRSSALCRTDSWQWGEGTMWNLGGLPGVFEGLDLHQVLWRFFVWTGLNGLGLIC